MTTAQPVTAHLRESFPDLPADVHEQRLAMLAGYLETSPDRYCQSFYTDTVALLVAPDARVLALWNWPVFRACAAGMAMLMFAHEDGEICGGGFVYAHKGRVIGVDQKACELLGITRECAASLFAACAPPAGVIASLRALSQGENMGPVMREYARA